MKRWWMISLGCGAVVTTSVLLATTSARMATVNAAPKLDLTEPAQELTVDIDGQSADCRIGEPTTIKVNGREIRVVVNPKPTRLLVTPEFSLRYPTSYAFEAETSPTLTSWSLDGSNGVLTVNRIPLGADPRAIVSATADALLQRFGERAKQEPVKLTFLGREQEGVRITARIADARITQDIYGFSLGGATYTIVVQDSLKDDGSGTEEVKQLRQLLTDTMRETP